MAPKPKRPVRDAGAPPRRGTKRVMLLIPEDVVTRLIDPQQVADGDDAEIDAALTNQIDAAASEVAQALAETGRSFAHLHALRVAAEGLGFRQGFRTGALAAGWVVHGLACDLDQGAHYAK